MVKLKIYIYIWNLIDYACATTLNDDLDKKKKAVLEVYFTPHNLIVLKFESYPKEKIQSLTNYIFSQEYAQFLQVLCQ